MPYSDIVPPLVAPDCAYGRKYRRHTMNESGGEGVYVALCGEWRPGGYYQRHDIGRPLEWDVCARRRIEGVHAHNWCCSCIAGYPQMLLNPDDDGIRLKRAVI